MKLSTISINNWHEFILDNKVDLSCQCDSNVGCVECYWLRSIFPTSNIAYDTGYIAIRDMKRLPYTGVVAFEYRGHVWMTTRLQIDVNPLPYLAAAWIKMFPKCEWLPEQFGDVNNILDFYAVLPKEDADAVVVKIRDSLTMNIEKSQLYLNKINQMVNPPF